MLFLDDDDQIPSPIPHEDVGSEGTSDESEMTPIVGNQRQHNITLEESDSCASGQTDPESLTDHTLMSEPTPKRPRIQQPEESDTEFADLEAELLPKPTGPTLRDSVHGEQLVDLTDKALLDTVATATAQEAMLRSAIKAARGYPQSTMRGNHKHHGNRGGGHSGHQGGASSGAPSANRYPRHDNPRPGQSFLGDGRSKNHRYRPARQQGATRQPQQLQQQSAWQQSSTPLGLPAAVPLNGSQVDFVSSPSSDLSSSNPRPKSQEEAKAILDLVSDLLRVGAIRKCKPLPDAATSGGWGAICGKSRVAGLWKEEDTSRIELLELKAIRLALKTLPFNWYRANIRLRVDNTVAISYINRAGGKIRSLDQEARLLWKFLEDNEATAYATYIPSKDNPADKLTRELTRAEGRELDAEWQLRPEIFADICASYETNSLIGLFSGLNAGVVYMRLDALRETNFVDTVVEIAGSYRDEIRRPDQDVLNIYCARFKERCKPLNCSLNYRPETCTGCPDASEKGIAILLGHNGVFHNPTPDNTYRGLYQAYQKCDFTPAAG
ncbi:unnamed protein product [Notodromas monacha]|uniref:UDP-D-xylose:beta-D-glucoside alpha-1,3-D-xylosyltransferase n=1 Tax=Notodromas monacha TaxID=399045 RepID=A0A7R9GGZ1_9CRUS|nr:unnamed protein product [Notodromas monacha]CAG0922354.1 unnamed protein product [Notodromas monacha]